MLLGLILLVRIFDIDQRYFSSIYQRIKKETLAGPLVTISCDGSHEVLNSNSSVVAVGVNTESTEALCGAFSEWVSNETVTSLEANFWLEGVLTDGTNHLERNIRTIEQTSVIR